MGTPNKTERVVTIRVWGRDFPVTLRRLESGKTHWSTPDGYWSELSGICASPLVALAAARDELQCRRQPADSGDLVSGPTDEQLQELANA